MVYINKERRLNEATKVRSKALQKAEHYRELKGPFVDWANQNNVPEEFVQKDLDRLDELIAYWMTEYELGER